MIANTELSGARNSYNTRSFPAGTILLDRLFRLNIIPLAAGLRRFRTTSHPDDRDKLDSAGILTHDPRPVIAPGRFGRPESRGRSVDGDGVGVRERLGRLEFDGEGDIDSISGVGVISSAVGEGIGVSISGSGVAVPISGVLLISGVDEGSGAPLGHRKVIVEKAVSPLLNRHEIRAIFAGRFLHGRARLEESPLIRNGRTLSRWTTSPLTMKRADLARRLNERRGMQIIEN